MFWQTLLVLCLTLRVACIKPGETLSDKDVERIAEQWDEDDEDEAVASITESVPTDGKVAPEQDDSAEPAVMIRVNFPEGSFSRQETDDLTKLWQVALLNANIPTEKYLVSSSAVLYLLNKAGRGGEARDFLVKQPECLSVHLNNHDYPCAGGGKQEL